MKRPELEVIRFEEPDIIATSGLGMTMNYFGDEKANNGEFTFFGRSSDNVWHNAHEEDIVSEFKSYFGGDWEDLDGITLNIAGGCNGLGEFVFSDKFDDLDYSIYSKYNGTYAYNNGSFSWRSN